MNSNKLLKVGIAGYGVVGRRRRLYIDEHPNLETVAVCDRTFAEDNSIQDGVKTFSRYQDLLKEDLDILFVCLTNDIAAEVCMAGLNLDMHVFCEKPPGRDLDEIAKVRKVEASKPNLKLKYGFNHRYHDSVKSALEVIRGNKLGKIINIRGVYGKSKILSFESGWRAQRDIAGGGILLDQGIHMVDLLRLFAGEFSEIHSFIDNSFWKHDVEDNAYALMKTEDGVVAFLNSTATQWRHQFQLEISLEKGGVTLSGILSGSKSYGAEKITIAYKSENDNGDPKEVTTKFNEDNSWNEEIEEFAEAILQDKPILNGSSLDAFKTMELVYRIYCADPKWKEKFNLKCTVTED
ncbi:MAG: putative dehydrogenase [Bacteriovoracaceae bacterium]|jgi:predicted dehydrogenase